MSNSSWPHGLQHARLLCASLFPRVCSNSCPFSWWCHPTVSSSVIPFFSCPQSQPSWGSFPVSWLFSSGGQKYWSLSFSISPSNEYSGLFFIRYQFLLLSLLNLFCGFWVYPCFWFLQYLYTYIKRWDYNHVHRNYLVKKILQNITEKIYLSHEIAQTRMTQFFHYVYIAESASHLTFSFFLFFLTICWFFEGVHTHAGLGN